MSKTTKGQMIVVQRSSGYTAADYSEVRRVTFEPMIVAKANVRGVALTAHRKGHVFHQIDMLGSQVFTVPTSRLGGLTPVEAVERLAESFDTIAEVKDAIRALASATVEG